MQAQMLSERSTPHDNSELPKPPHATWLWESARVGWEAALIFGSILGCAGVLASSNRFFPWVELLALVAAAAAGVVTARGSWAINQERFRAKHNLCPHCGYSLTANTSGTCPECGSPVPAKTKGVA